MGPFSRPRIFQSSAKAVSYHYLAAGPSQTTEIPRDTSAALPTQCPCPGCPQEGWDKVLEGFGQGWEGPLPGAGDQASTGCPLPFLLLSRLKEPWNKEQG